MEPTIPQEQSSLPIPQEVQQKSFSTKISLVIGIVLFGIFMLITGYFLGVLHNSSKNKDVTAQPTSELSSLVTPIPSPTTIPTPTDVSGWKTYTNPTYHYSFNYPPSWQLNTSNDTPKDTGDPCAGNSQIIATTPEGYQFQFGWNLKCVGGQGIRFEKYENVVIDGIPFVKGYFGDCISTESGTPMPCGTVFSEITYVPADQVIFSNHLIGTLFTHNNIEASIIFAFQKTIVLDSFTATRYPTYATTEEDLNKVVASIKFPN